MSYDDKQLLEIMFVDANTLRCPLFACQQGFKVPDIPVSDVLGAAFGMSGETLARVHGDQELNRVVGDIRRHLAAHPFDDWLEDLESTREALRGQLAMWAEVRG